MRRSAFVRTGIDFVSRQVSAFGKFLTWLLTSSPRALELTPDRDIALVGDEFESTGTSAHFQVAGDAATLAPGWYRLELSISNNNAVVMPSVVIDYGSSCTVESFPPIFSGGGVRTRTIIVTKNARVSEFSPTRRPGRLGTIRLSISRCRRMAIVGYYLAERPKHSLRLPLVAWREGLRNARNLVADELLDRTSQAAYDQWIALHDIPSERDVQLMRKDIEAFRTKPKFSVVMPVYNTEPKWLERAIESVRDQIYPNWELCIADDASTRADTRAALDRVEGIDERIKITYRKTNGNISTASNSALSLASGDYVALLDHDDEISPYALYWVAKEIDAHPDADLIYSDFDVISETGQRHGAYFKPDWSPSLIMSQNFFCHLAVYRRALIEKVGGFRAGYEGSQDHDLTLRCSEHTQPARIRHIPRVLYHWRALPTSTAGRGLAAKPYAWEAGRRAIADHLQRQNVRARVEQTAGIFYQVEYEFDAKQLPKVTILMPSPLRHRKLEACIGAVLSMTTYPNFELLILTADSDAKTERGRRLRASIAGDPRVRMLVYPDRKFNYSLVNDLGVEQSSGEVLCFLNDDIKPITPDWLEKLVVRLALPKVGAVGSLLFYPNDRIQHAGIIIGLGGVCANAHANSWRDSNTYYSRNWLEQDYSAVTAACMVMRRNVYLEVGGFDAEFAGAYQDVDLCLRLREKGYRVLFTPTARLYHHESASFGPPTSPERAAQFNREVEMFRTKWAHLLDCDPYYNPNLTLSTANPFGLAFPPRVAPPGR